MGRIFNEILVMKAIILAGGSGTRLAPLTNTISKQLLPIYDKPMIYYPLASIMSIGIKDIMIISTPEDLPRIQELLGDGKNLGISLEYQIQEKPEGIAQAFILAEDFIGSSSVSLILGDNIFYGRDLNCYTQSDALSNIVTLEEGAAVIAYPVKDPERFGVVGFAKDELVTSIEEKPKQPKSNYAVTGWYFYDNKVVDIAKNLAPSARGELEITDVNTKYLELNQLNVLKMSRDFTWLDAGTHDALYEATRFVKVMESSQNIKIGCLEEIAFYKNYIKKEQLAKLSESYKIGNNYGDYLRRLIKEH